jgi:peptidoglycan/xylan/chitin deacetylase (PgdA/CDA1 family)
MRVEARRALLQGVKLTASIVDRVRTLERGVVVLLYHRVGGRSGLEMDLPMRLFARQIESLSQGDVLSLPKALSLLDSNDAGQDGRPPVVLSFDDGTADFVDTALPILVRFGIPATLYVATRFIEEGRDFPRGGHPLSWAGLREALSTGLVTIGSHTHSHLLLDRLTPVVAETELRRSIDLIGERLGSSVDHFAYPKAVLPGPTVEAIVRRLFVSASVGGNRVNVLGCTDRHRLARSPIQASDGMRWFEAKRSGGLLLEERLRRALNNLRYNSASA